jgi:MFS family permease
MTMISGLVFGAVGVSSPLMTLYLQSLGASFAQISLILTSVAAILMFSNYIWGRISDRIGRRKPLIVGGLGSMACAFMLLSQAPNANWAWGVRVFEGISMAAYLTTSLALMGDLLTSEGHRGRHMGIYRGIGSVAFAVGAVTGGRLADMFSISTALYAAAGFYLAAALVALTLRETRAASTAEETPAQTPAQSKAERLPILFLGGVLLWTMAHGASTSMWPNYMDTFGYNKTTISSLWGFAAVVEGIGMPLIGSLSDVVGRAPLLIAGGIGIMLVQVGYITVAAYLPALVGVQAVRGFGFASYTTCAMTFASELGSKRVRGNNSGTFNAAGSSGQLIGALIGGTLVELMGFKFLFSVCAVAALSSAACFWLLRYRARREAAQVSAA